MANWDKVGLALAGFGAGVEGRGQEFLAGIQRQKELEAQKSQLADLAGTNDPGVILKTLGASDPAYLAKYAEYMAKQNEPKLPRTDGLPQGYMWQNGQAVNIPGVPLRSEAPLSPEAKLTSDFKSGLIDEDTYKRALSKQIAPTEKSYKQFQLQAASFADRMAKSEGLLQPFEDANVDLVNTGASAAGKIPFAGKFIENSMLSDEQQLYRNAASEWIRAKLRKESGAAIPDSEMEQEYRTYFPVPGDNLETIKQKAELRKNNTASMIKQASGAYEDQYLGEVLGETSAAPATSPSKGRVLIFDSKGNIVE